MENNVSLKQLYKEQYDACPTFSQDEIVSLYESEGIIDTTSDEMLKRLKEVIEEKKCRLNTLKLTMPENYLLSSYKNTSSKGQQIINLKKFIERLELQVNELSVLHQDFSELLPGEFNDDKFDNIIDELNKEITAKKREVDKLTKQREKEISLNKDEIIVLEAELKELEMNADKLRRSYKKYAHKLFISIRGVVSKDRKFPSYELRNKIVSGHIWLAKYLAGIYYRKSDNTIPFDDLFQMANDALISAAHYYVPNGSAKFTTYARKCIENRLKREIYGKKKKRKYKPELFFKNEKDNIQYIKFFLESIETISRSGRSYFSDNYFPRTSLILYRFRKRLREYNRDMRMRGETRSFLPSFSPNKSTQKLDEIINRIINMISKSKMNALITNEDRDLASMFVSYQGKPSDMHELYQVIYFLDFYIHKLDLIEQYLKIEEELTLKHDGITPSDDEVLKEFNRQIKARNQETYKLKKSGFFKGYIPIYKEYFDYYNEYLKEYKVDPFISPDEYERCGISSKKREYDDISDDYAVDERIENIDYIISDINNYNCDKIVLFFSDDEIMVYDDWDFYDENEEYDDCDILTKSEALEKLSAIRDSIPMMSEEEFVQMVLQKRKDTINAMLEAKNAPIREYNREIARQRDSFKSGDKYQKRLSERNIAEIKRDIELLFGDDSELFILLSANRRKDRWYQRSDIPVEDEVLNNMFLNDYYDEVGKLPEIEREVLLRFFDSNGFHSMKAKEIGSELGITEGQVYRAKTRALRKLSLSQKLRSYNEES